MYKRQGVDGLPPSGGSPSPYYIFESEDDVKYYITNEDEACGRGTAYLTENADGTLRLNLVISGGTLEYVYTLSDDGSTVELCSPGTDTVHKWTKA